MVNNINSFENNYKVSNAGLNQDELKSTISKSKEVVTDNFESNTAGKMVNGAKDQDVMKKTLLVLPFLVVLDNFVNKLIAGNKDKNLLNGIAKIGDNISNKLHLEKLKLSDKKNDINNFIKNNKFTKYFTNDFKAIPKNSMAKSQTMTEKYAEQLVSALKEMPEGEKYLSKMSGYFKPSTLEHFGLDGFSATGKSLTKDIADDLTNGVDKLLKNGVNNIIEKPGKFGSKKINISELRNKFAASNSQIGKTGLGKIFSKGFLKSKDTLTFGGGLLSLAFTANAIVQAVKAAKEAPKGEKKSTFMHVLSENYVGMILFTPSINLLYKTGGNKYRGMTVEGREALKNLIQKTNADKTLTKEGYKIANLQKKLLLKGVSKDKVADLSGKSLKEAKNLAKTLKNQGAKLKFWEKPLKSAATVLNTGLDTIKSPSKLGKIGQKLKGFGGGFARFALIMFVIQPLIQKPVTKLIHKIFGKPETYLAKQEAENNKDSVNNNSNTMAQTPYPNSNNSETNLIKLWTEPAVQDSKSDSDFVNANTNNTNTQEIPALNLNKNGNSSRYIPSIEPNDFTDVDAENKLKAQQLLKEMSDTLNKYEKKSN